MTKQRLQACRVCGCTEDHACEGSCWWVRVEKDSPPLCSSCAGSTGDLAEALKRIAALALGWVGLSAPARVKRAALIARAARKRARLRAEGKPQGL